MPSSWARACSITAGSTLRCRDRRRMRAVRTTAARRAAWPTPTARRSPARSRGSGWRRGRPGPICSQVAGDVLELRGGGLELAEATPTWAPPAARRCRRPVQLVDGRGAVVARSCLTASSWSATLSVFVSGREPMKLRTRPRGGARPAWSRRSSGSGQPGGRVGAVGVDHHHVERLHLPGAEVLGQHVEAHCGLRCPWAGRPAGRSRGRARCRTRPAAPGRSPAPGRRPTGRLTTLPAQACQTPASFMWRALRGQKAWWPEDASAWPG